MATAQDIVGNPITRALENYSQGQVDLARLKLAQQMKDADERQRHDEAMALLTARMGGEKSIEQMREAAANERARTGDASALERAMAIQKTEGERQIMVAAEARRENEKTKRDDMYAKAIAADPNWRPDPEKTADENDADARDTIHRADAKSLSKLVLERRKIKDEIDSLMTPRTVDSATLTKAVLADPISASLNPAQRHLLQTGKADVDSLGISDTKFLTAVQFLRDGLEKKLNAEAQMKAGAHLRILQGRHDELGSALNAAVRDVPVHQLGDALTIPDVPAGVKAQLGGWNPVAPKPVGMGNLHTSEALAPPVGAMVNPTAVIAGARPVAAPVDSSGYDFAKQYGYSTPMARQGSYARPGADDPVAAMKVLLDARQRAVTDPSRGAGQHVRAIDAAINSLRAHIPQPSDVLSPPPVTTNPPVIDPNAVLAAPY